MEDPDDMAEPALIRVVGAREHNLKNVSVDIPRGMLTVVAGPSGSGKSSLAFDTIYAEGQRRYVESLSTSARQFLEQMPKPDVDRIEGLCPTIAIDQRAATASPRSIVATTTEIYDFLRVLFARLGEPRCPKCDRPIVRRTTAQMVDAVLASPEGTRIMVLAPVVRDQRGSHKTILADMQREGYIRVRVDGQLTLIEDMAPLAGNRKHTVDVVIDRLTVKEGVAQRLADSIETATRLSSGSVIIAMETAPGVFSDEGFSASLACPEHPEVRLDELSPRLFSFNSPHGACATCDGLGTKLEFDPDLVVPDSNLSLAAGAVAAWRTTARGRGGAGRPRRDAEDAPAAEPAGSADARSLAEFCEQFAVLPDAPFRNLPEAKRRILLFGTTAQDEAKFKAAFGGVIPELQRRWEGTESETVKQRLHGFLSEAPCPACGGARLNPSALCVRVADRTIADIVRMTVVEASTFFEALSFEGEAAVVAAPLLREIASRLRFLVEVGVHYLSLNRASATLSGGEAQRIRLATQIGSGLVGVCYVLDEPTVGLHARDSDRLAGILTRLSQLGNTVIVVEHDEQIIRRADHVIDVGPGAGERGGHILAAGTLAEVLADGRSITAKYLTGERTIAPPEQRRRPDPRAMLEIRGAREHNLRSITVRVPLGLFVCVTGVSGSGKSTLINQVLLRALKRSLQGGGPRPGAYDELLGAGQIDKVIEINQAPIGRTPRSNPATYVGVFDLIRQLYAKTREARIRGYGPERFSFNVKGGRCERCRGQGVRRIEMHFLPDVFVRCDACNGSRFARETLEVRFRGKSIADVLELRVDEACGFFESFANVRQRLGALKDVGLGYVKLGQSGDTLSGGEAQRVKLAAELGKSTEGRTIYILDEPTTGLHFSDVNMLMSVLNRLVDRGHSVLVIEHNLDVIRLADWVIDLGPEGGEGGGLLVAEGPPEAIAACESSHTGRFLRQHAARSIED
jgi:excinuclease ABC subunit A